VVWRDEVEWTESKSMFGGGDGLVLMQAAGMGGGMRETETCDDE
jgi:hypothetical protein